MRFLRPPAYNPTTQRQYLEEQKGLGTSQKAEVAWLDRCGYDYEELDVRDFAALPT